MQLDNWTHIDDVRLRKHDQHPTTAAPVPVITVSVPPGQLQAGQLLIRCFYEAGSPNFRLNQLPQLQLLQLLLLADRYNALPVAMAAAAALGSLMPEDMHWNVVVQLHELQQQMNTLKVLPGYTAALAAASHKLHNALGDLEVAWQYDETAKLLRQLPFCLVHQLLSDNRTRVASEDTVVYTVHQWLKQQALPAAAGPGTTASSFTLDQQAEQLVQLIRLPKCSPLFLATVAPNASWLLQYLTAAELATAATIAQQPEVMTSNNPVKQALSTRSSVIARREAWKLPPRPMSAVGDLVLDWEVPLQQLKQLVEGRLQCTRPTQLLQRVPGVEEYPAAAAVPVALFCTNARAPAVDGIAADSIQSKSGMWQGREFYLKMQVSDSRKLMVSLCMKPMMPEDVGEKQGGHAGDEAMQREQEMTVVLCSICAVRFGSQEVCRKAERYRTIVAGSNGYTWTDFFGLGEVSSWAGVKTGLITKHQVAIGDASILVRAKLAAVW